MRGNYKKQKPPIDLSSFNLGRLPPQNTDCERKLLGVIIQSSDALSDVVPILPSEDHFFLDVHRIIYAAILHLYQKGGQVDNITIVTELVRRGELAKIGGAYVISEIENEVSSNAKCLDWAMIVKEKSTLRAIIANCGQLLTEAYEDSTDVFELLDRAQGLMQTVSDSNYAGSLKSMVKTAAKYLERMEKNRQSPFDFTGVPTGYYSLDRLTGGFQKTDLILLSAENSTGKTAFLLNVAWNAATHPQKPSPVIIFSLEMSCNPVLNRIVSNVGNIQMNSLNQPKLLSTIETTQVLETINIITSKPILIDDTTGITTMEIKAKTRKFIKQHGPDILVIVDYIQLVKVMNCEGMSNEEKISKVSQHLKEIAKDLDVPIIAISSLSRDGKLRGSGNLDFDADVIIHIRKPSKEDLDTHKNAHPDDRIFDITKHRNGETNFVMLRFIKEFQRFIDMADIRNEFKAKPLVPPQKIDFNDNIF